ncbi:MULTISPECIES: DUF2968 domain-containing protein [Caballeronia]|jgi:hypothetical protein|uniref:Signal peptide protein n=1 Tax=Caballeronia zhejiangensis TaxID=871203 RepID=A0A656QFW9_9BURK|nr:MULTISPECIES: DUF2968 domain-containing protein [Caballeronia]KDR28671.1 signal peptide protein [Caballeronia zhejiangensis]MDR5765824.1 DUF2968 domain-containing protein [Caballeronia sp. LZ028]
MKQLRHHLRYATLALALSLCGFLAPFGSTFAAPATAAKSAASEPAQPAPVDLSDLTANSNAPRVEGNIAELQSLVQAGSLTELRATRNGSYGARLYFLAQEMLYYVALSQDARLWRVVKTQDAARAETIYAQFSRKSFELADGEIRRAQLQAQKALLDRVIAKSADRANRLTADLELAQQQDSQVSQRQQQLQAESAVLQTDKLEAERKLRTLQLQVEQLQKQTEAGLAPVSASPSR